MVYQPGKANIVTDVLSQSRPNADKFEESAQQEHQDDQDAENQYDQAFTVISSVRIEESVLVVLRDIQ